MAIQYAGGTIVNATFTSDGTRADLVSNLNTQLKTAGWSVISGDGTGDVLMKTAVTPQSASCRVRLYDPGSGNCAQVTFRDNTGTYISDIAYLLPTNDKEFRIIANKYQFFFFSTGSANKAVAREIVMGGVLYLPPFMETALSGVVDNFWMLFNGSSDTGTTARSTFRDSLQGLYTSPTYGAGFMNGTLTKYTNGYYPPSLRLLGLPGSGSGIAGISTWFDGSAPTADAVIMWGGNAGNPVSLARGLLWDAFVLFTQSLAGEQTIAGPDSGSFMVITHAVSQQLCVKVG